MDSSAIGAGWLGSLRGFADGVAASVHDRFRLPALELHEEKFRLIQILIWLTAIVALGFLALIFASLAVLMVFWETARVPVAIGLASGYTLGLVGVVFGFRRYLARQPKPFAATLEEFQEDRTCIRKPS